MKIKRSHGLIVKQTAIKFFKRHPQGSPILRKICHIPVRATEFVEIANLVPKQWRKWFYVELCEIGSLTWGDANRTMITADYLADIFQYMSIGNNQTTQGARREWLKKIRRLGQMYVDLEN